MRMIWRDIPSLEGRYQVSNTGEIRSLPRNTTRGKILRQGNVSGYRVFGHNCGYRKNKQMRVHRAVARVFLPNPENKPQINHKNGIKDDNRVENLEWATCSENHLHAYASGLKSMVGEKHNQVKLTDEIVNSIRAEYIPGTTWKPGNIYELTKKYGIARSTVSGIISGHRWKHLLQESAN